MPVDVEVVSVPIDRDLWIYVDETEHLDAGRRGVIALVAFEPVGQDLIGDALARLAADFDAGIEADPRRAANRKAILERGYFHASGDMRDAHSAFCDAMREHFVGQAHCAFIAPDNRHVSDHTAAELNQLLGGLAVNLVFSSPRRVHLVVEQGLGITEGNAADVIDDWCLSQEKVLHESATIPYYRPRIDVTVAGKDEPGLQVADFVLWAFMRRRHDPKDPWLGRLATKLSFDMKGPPDHPDGHDYTLGKHSQLEPDPLLAVATGPVSTETLNEDEAFDRLAMAERVVHVLARRPAESPAAHLVPDARRLSRTMQLRRRLHRDDVVAMARLALQGVHTANVYGSNLPQADIQRIYEATHLWSRMLDTRWIQAARLCNWYIHGRKEHVAKQPTVFGLDAAPPAAVQA